MYANMVWLRYGLRKLVLKLMKLISYELDQIVSGPETPSLDLGFNDGNDGSGFE